MWDTIRQQPSPLCYFWEHEDSASLRPVPPPLAVFHAWTGSGAGLATVLVDLSARVSNYGDHGLIALHYSTTGGAFLYATYMHRGTLWNNVCTDAGMPGGRELDTIEGCRIYGRFVRWPVRADGTIVDAEEEVIMNTEDATHTARDGTVIGNGCVQFSTHSVPAGIAELGGYIYTSHGDGAGFNMVDAGQLGTNQGGCNDNPGYYGAFRSQDPTRINGKILRWTPGTTAAAFEFDVWTIGHRNPYRLSADVANNRLLATETGWYTAEEVNVISVDPAAQGTNYGWPCTEGPIATPEYLNFVAPYGVPGSDGIPGQYPNRQCAAIQAAPTVSWYYYHPPIGPTNNAAISGVLAANGRIYYTDIAQGWIRSIPDTHPTGVVEGDISGPGMANAASPAVPDMVVEIATQGATELRMSPFGLIYIAHYEGEIKLLVSAMVILPSPSPIPAFALLSTPDGHDWVAGSAANITLTSSTNVAGYGATAGREGTTYAWTATLLADCTPSGDCTSTRMVVPTPGQDASLRLPTPAYPGTIEVLLTVSTGAGATTNTSAYLTASSSETVCTCPGVRVSLAAIPSYSPGPTSPRPAVDVSSTAFLAGVVTASVVLAAALVAVGVTASLRAKAAARPAPPPASRLGNTATLTSSNDGPVAVNPGGPAKTKAAFAQQGATTPAFASPKGAGAMPSARQV